MIDTVFVSGLSRLELILRFNPLVHHLHRDPLVLLLVGVILFLVFVDVNTVFWNICHLHSRSMRQHSQILQQSRSDLVHVFSCVLIAHVTGSDVKFEIWSKIFKVVIVGQLIGNILFQSNSCFICPTSRNISDGITSATQQHQWKIVSLHEFYTFSMSLQSQVETSQSVSGKR